MFRLILILSVVFIFYSCSNQKFIVISKKIENKCEKNKSWKGETFHDLRSKLYKEGKFDSILSKLDTLYILETYDIESGQYVCEMWNEQDTINFTYNNKQFNFDQNKYFTRYTIELTQRWDTTTIREEEKGNANLIPEMWIKAIRVTASKAIKIDCISFRQFFSLDRDRDNNLSN